MDEQELNRKLAEWAGFYLYSEETRGSISEWWHYPNSAICFDIDFPKFTQSLDACFEWLEKPLVDHFIDTTSTEEEYRQALYSFLREWLKDYIWNEPHLPALALCLAIEKLIGSETISKWGEKNEKNKS